MFRNFESFKIFIKDESFQNYKLIKTFDSKLILYFKNFIINKSFENLKKFNYFC